MYRSDLIRIAMAKLDLTGEELARRASISRPTVSAIVNGKNVTLESLSAVATALDLKLSDLFVVADPQTTEELATVT